MYRTRERNGLALGLLGLVFGMVMLIFCWKIVAQVLNIQRARLGNYEMSAGQVGRPSSNNPISERGQSVTDNRPLSVRKVTVVCAELAGVLVVLLFIRFVPDARQ
jgi:hypothetical protein